MHKSQIIGRDRVQEALFTTDNKITVSKSPFSAFESNEESELVFKGRTTYMNTEHIILQVNNGNLKIKDEDTTDLEILKALDELEFATSRMITIYLNLIGTYISQEKVQKRLYTMNKLRVLSCYEFRSKDKNGNEKYSHASVYFLDVASLFLLKSQGITTKYKLETTLKSKTGIKEVLSRNQLMLIYAENIKNINYTKNNPIYTLPNGDKYIPGLQIVLDYKDKMHHMIFEIIRSFDGWEQKIVEQLYKYKYFIETFKPSKTINEPPRMVLVAEDDHHAFNVMKLILENNLVVQSNPYYYTTDNRLITSDIVNSLFRFVIEDNVAKAKILTIDLFEV